MSILTEQTASPLLPDDRPGVLLAARRFGYSFVNLPHLWGSVGFNVDLVAPRGNYLRHSRWLHRCFITVDEDRAFSRCVCARLASGDYRFLVIVDEPALTAIYADPARHAIAPYLPLAPDGDLARTIGRKDLFHDWCEAHDIPTPRTIRTDSWERTEQVCQDLGWPCVLKGIDGFGGQAVFIVHDLEQARQHRARLERDPCWIVQEFVDGTVGSAPMFAVRGELRAWMAMEKVICLLGGKGPRVMGDFMADERIEAVCRKIAQAGELHCMTSFDFVQRRSGEIVVIDPHLGRCATIFHVGALCGVDFGRVLKEWADGRDVFHRPTPCDIRIVKYPEALQYLFQFGPVRLFRQAPLFSRKVQYFWGPPGDWKLFLIMSASTFISSARVALGAWRASAKLRFAGFARTLQGLVAKSPRGMDGKRAR